MFIMRFILVVCFCRQFARRLLFRRVPAFCLLEDFPDFPEEFLENSGKLSGKPTQATVDVLFAHGCLQPRKGDDNPPLSLVVILPDSLRMETPAENPNAKKTAQEAVVGASVEGVESPARQDGRRLILKFIGGDHPELDRIECRWSEKSQSAHWQQGDTENQLHWREVAQALSLVFLDYLAAGEGTVGPLFFCGARNGSLAASLGDAISDNSARLHLLLMQRLESRPPVSRVKQVFGGVNIHGKDKENDQRRIFVRPESLPSDCIEVYWTLHSPGRITDRAVFRELARRIRKSLGLPVEHELSAGEGSPAKTPPRPAEAKGTQPSLPLGMEQAPVPPPSPKSEPEAPPPLLPYGKPAPASATELLDEPMQPQSESFKLSRWLAQEFRAALNALQASPKPEPPPQTPPAYHPAPDTPSRPAEESSAVTHPVQDLVIELKAQPDSKARGPSTTEKQPPPEFSPDTVSRSAETSRAPTHPIDPRLFQVASDGTSWPDDAVLLSFGGEHALWTLRNAFEGTLILGATGSGKTSGSGAAIAEAFLRSGFGGLILTAKIGEADYWQKLCGYCGRGGDFVRVCRGGSWKLNILSYEAQRPGPGGGLSENLLSFSKNLLKISARQQAAAVNDEFWQKASDQLLHATFDLFLLAGGAVTFDRLSDFIAAAPTEVPSNSQAWLNRPPFSDLIVKAREAARTEEDQRILHRALDYWLKIYPGLASRTRTSITIGVYAMLDAFRGRDIPDLISSDTNLTPESIMSGNIVVLDLPLKEFGHTGLLIQSAWKYLFQTALERQGNAANPKRRPVFLWEDEAQYFVSDHDHHFQDTARSSRVCRVLLSQNLHSFYREFGPNGTEAADSVFSNLNTKIFHANSDPTTNDWSAKQLGKEVHTRYTISHSPPPPARDFWDSVRRAIDPPHTTNVSAAEHLEYAIEADKFAELRTGGLENDFQVDAYVTWVGLSAERERHFMQTTFNQNQNL
jgi:hypothetical protein